MKTLLSLLAVAGVTMSALAQGEVEFRNRVSYLGPDGQRITYDRRIDTSLGQPLAGPDYAAQLFYGSSLDNLLPVTNPPAPFRTGAGAGYWMPGFNTRRILHGFVAGDTVWMEVRIWNYSLFPDWESAVASGQPYGRSCPFTYTIPPTNAHESAFVMQNFVSEWWDCASILFPWQRVDDWLVISFYSPWPARVLQSTNLASVAWDPVPATNGILKVPMTNSLMFYRIETESAPRR